TKGWIGVVRRIRRHAGVIERRGFVGREQMSLTKRSTLLDHAAIAGGMARIDAHGEAGSPQAVVGVDGRDRVDVEVAQYDGDAVVALGVEVGDMLELLH